MNAKRLASARKVLGWTFGTIFIVLLLASILLPSMGRPREPAQRVKCASNLKQIWMAIFTYASENRGLLPPDWPTLYTTQGLVPEVFICPSCDLDKASGATTQQIVTSMLEGDHFSYALVNEGVKLTHWPDFVIAFDLEKHVPKGLAATTGINVLLSDGSVQFVDDKTAKAIWARYVAGVRPIRLSDCTTPPATKPG